MPNADGSVVIQVDADDKKAMAELNRLNRKIQSLQDQIYVKKQQRLPLLEQSDTLVARLDKAKAKLDEMQHAPAGTYFSDSEIKRQEQIVKELQKEWDSVQEKVESYDAAIKKANIELDLQKGKVGEVKKGLALASKDSSDMPDAMALANQHMEQFTKRITGLAKRIFVFSLITAGLRQMRTWLWNVIQTNSEATAAMARLKGALLTLAQPILEVVIPAFIALVNILTQVVSIVAQLVSFLFGKTIGQSKAAAKGLNAEKKALSGVGGAAEDAAGSLASFDEINQITTENAGGGGGGGVSTDIEPDFNFDATLGEDQLKNLLGLIEAIGSALLAWRIGSALGLGMKETLGLALGIYEAIQFVKNAFDAWVNGVDWDNLLGMLASSAGMAAGFALAFGKTGAGISLVITGLSMLITGFHDAFENGWNLQNTLLSIAGILETGMGISLLTGSWIPLLIAGIGATLLALTVATGHGEELLNGVRDVMEGFVGFFKDVFTGDIEGAIERLGQIFEGFKTIVGAVFDSVRDTLVSFLDWLDEKTNGRFHLIIEVAKSFIIGWSDSVKTTLQDALDAVKLIFTGIVQFLSGVFTNDWDKAWEGVKNIFKGVWNGIVALLEGACNLVVKGLNFLIQKINTLSFTAPDWVPEVGGKTFGFHIPEFRNVSIPRLATGAVVPPNREFMAMLGDNKTETEVVSPLSTIEQALENVLSHTGGMGSGTITVNLVVDGKKLARVVVPAINDMSFAAGKSVLRM